MLWLNKPQSYSNITGITFLICNCLALAVTSIAWFLAIANLYIGNLVRLPQTWYGLRGFWLSQFLSQLLLFAEFSLLHPGGNFNQLNSFLELIHLLRGFYLTSCFLLFLLNFNPVDQEIYDEIVIEGQSSTPSIFERLIDPCVDSDNVMDHFGACNKTKGEKAIFSEENSPLIS